MKHSTCYPETPTRKGSNDLKTWILKLKFNMRKSSYSKNLTRGDGELNKSMKLVEEKGIRTQYSKLTKNGQKPEIIKRWVDDERG